MAEWWQQAAGEELTTAERFRLLAIYNVAYHTTGKIEEIFSLDSSATNCMYCQAMREYAKRHPELAIVCGHCYDYKQEQYRFEALDRHSLNMLIMENFEFSVAELAIIPAGFRVRVNSSGDASNDIYAANMIKFAIAHPASRVAIWTKNTAAYIRACDVYGKPANVVMIQSSLFIDKPVKLARYFDYTFTVYFDGEKIAAALAGGACECNGKKCKDCGFKCYDRAWPVGADIAEFLRK